MNTNGYSNGDGFDDVRSTDGASASTMEERCADAVLWPSTDGSAPQDASIEDASAAELARELAAFERAGAAAAASLVQLDPEEPPAGLRAKLEQSAVAFLVERHGLRLRDLEGVIAREPSLHAVPAPVAPEGSTPAKPGRVIDTTWISNAVAAAALIVAFVLYWSRPERPPAIEQAYTQLLQSPTLVRYDWADGPSSLGGTASGHVVWDADQQQGFMVFDELAPNTEEFQYQLWIFDGSRGVNIPVDGGLFDVRTSAGRVIVPIQAKIPVQEAFAFAVTAEPPGGVVVSKRDEIISVAGAVERIGPPKLN